MDSPVSSASVYLIEVAFDLYLLVIMLRLLLQTVRADFYNSFCQFIVKITNPPLIPLRRIIPSIKGIDTASIILLLALQIIAEVLINITMGQQFALTSVFILAIAELISLLLNIYLIILIVQIIISWVGPGTYNPILAILDQISAPLMRRAHRIVPTISGIDLSPLLILVLIQLSKILIVGPLTLMGYQLR